MPIELADLYQRTRAARKVIVVALGFLGDSLHLIPALWEIKRNYPGAELHVATTPLGCEVIQLVPCVDRVWPVARNPRQSNWRRDWAIVKAMRRERFDLAINLSSSDRTILWTALSGARCRVAHTGPRKQFWRTWLIPYWVPRQPAGMPIGEQHLQVLAACGLTLSAPCRSFTLPEEAQRKAESLVPESAIHFSICASSPLKEWPAENWIGLAKRLLALDPQLRLVATASPQQREQERLQFLAQQVGSERLTSLSGLSIAELAAVLQRCRLHVGADSGVLHLAVAVGLPTVSLFRDYHDASSWTPIGPAHRVFRAPCVCVNQREQPCASAQRADCLARLEVGQIEAAVREQLAGSRTRADNNKLA
ncbi:MAG: glycosyltransferase family 9 protein [Verrucomicrobiota bacterium]